MRQRLLLLVAFALSSVARAAAAPTFKHEDFAAAPATAVTIEIVSPKPGETKDTHQAESADGEIPCLLNDADREIKLSVSGWAVKPGGPGLLVELDGRFATVVHDLSKPIRMDDIEPYNQGKAAETTQSPVAGCGWHWIAVVPTSSDGRMLALKPVITWFKKESERRQTQNSLEDQQKIALVVVNWPLLGAPVAGKNDGDSKEPPGYLARTPNKLPFEFQIAQNDDCHTAEIEFNGTSKDVEAGLTSIEPFTIEYKHEQLLWRPKCGTGENSAEFGIWRTQPTLKQRGDWPRMSAALLAKAEAKRRADHRLPGAHPYDGTFFQQGVTGHGSLDCPASLTIKNETSSFMLTSAKAVSLGTVKFKVDRDGYINPQTVKLGKPKPLKGGESTEAANDISAVVVSGSAERELILHSTGPSDAPSVRIDLRVEAIDASGERNGSYCETGMRKEGHFSSLATCSHDPKKCGRKGELHCCE